MYSCCLLFVYDALETLIVFMKSIVEYREQKQSVPVKACKDLNEESSLSDLLFNQ